MPVIYAHTKKGQLEALLRKSSKALTKKEMIEAMASLGVVISRSSVNSAIEEWEMNHNIRVEDGKYLWKHRCHD